VLSAITPVNFYWWTGFAAKRKG